MFDVVGDRARLAAFVGILSGCNAIGSQLVDGLWRLGVGPTILSLAGVSAGVWFALIGCYLIATEAGPIEPVDAVDRGAAAAMLAAAFFPVANAGAAAVFLGGICFASRSHAGDRTRRIGIILLALSGTLFWGRLILLVFGERLLALDGSFVAALAQTSASGNIVAFVDGGHFVIGSACSSMHNMTFALLLWGTVTQLLKLRITPRLIIMCLAAMAATILVNGIRLMTIARYPRHFDYFHAGDGALLFGWLGLTVAAIVVGAGAYVEARHRL